MEPSDEEPTLLRSREACVVERASADLVQSFTGKVLDSLAPAWDTADS